MNKTAVVNLNIVFTALNLITGIIFILLTIKKFHRIHYKLPIIITQLVWVTASIASDYYLYIQTESNAVPIKIDYIMFAVLTVLNIVLGIYTVIIVLEYYRGYCTLLYFILLMAVATLFMYFYGDGGFSIPFSIPECLFEFQGE